MIAGFNTDIEFEGVVYHVQTEDKGAPARIIMTLVFDGGTILASKRAKYDDLANGNFDEKVLAERVGRQHKLICAAVGAGRMDELKAMSGKAAQAKTGVFQPVIETVAVSAAISQTPPPVAGPVAMEPIISVAPHSPPSVAVSMRVAQEPILAPVDLFIDAPLFEDVSIIEEVVLEAGAVEVVSELSGIERPTNEKLSLELLGETPFKGGDRRTVNIMICRGTSRRVVASAQVMIKVLGSTFRPVIFHAKTDANGLASVHLQLPHFTGGRAALLVRAITDREEIELRRLITPG